MAKVLEKSPKDSAFLTRKIVTSDQLNPNGTLFGGVIMAWIDEVAFMSARRYSGRPFVVTASIDNITFMMPLRLGDHVILTSQVNYVGNTSMEIGVKVERENPYTGERAQATSAYLTFVALDKHGRPKPLPKLILETPEDQRRYEEARLRVKVRERIRAHLKRKYESNQAKAPPPRKPARAFEKIQSGVQSAVSKVMTEYPNIGLPKSLRARLPGAKTEK